MLNGARAVKVRLLELVDAGRCGGREQNDNVIAMIPLDLIQSVCCN